MQLKSRLADMPNPDAILRHFMMYKALLVTIIFSFSGDDL
jgi:hypothetical protein